MQNLLNPPTGEGYIHFWNFGDGSPPESGTTATHLYPLPGTYTVTHTVTNACGSDVETATITVTDPTEGCANSDASNTVGTPGGQTTITQALAQNILQASGTGQTICIAGDLVVEALTSYYFANSVVRMLEGARILVRDGGTLVLYNSFFHGCTAMWRGIEVEAGGHLTLKTNNRLDDAQYAIYVHAAAVGEPVKEVNVQSNYFIDNFVGIYMGSQNAGVVNAFIAGNDFQNAEPLLPPFAGQTATALGLPEQNGFSLAGIYVDRVATLFSSQKNTFSDLVSGIVLLNTTGIVSENSFEGMTAHMDAYPGYAVAGYALYRQSQRGGMLTALDNTFSNCDWGIVNGGGSLEAAGNFLAQTRGGIFAGNNRAGAISIGGDGSALINRLEVTEIGIMVNATDPAASVDIINNEVETAFNGDGLGVGIWLVGNRAEAETRGNLVDVGQGGAGIGLLASQNASVDQNTVRLLSPAQAIAGISLGGGKACTITNNTIEGAGLSGDNNKGIEIFSSSDNAYCCNTIDNTRYGVYVQGASTATDGLRGNSFGLHEAGLWLDGSTAMLGSQAHTENCWANGGRAVYDGVTEDFAASLPFIIDVGDNSCFLPAEVEPSQGWFRDDPNPIQSDPCAAPQCSLAGFDPESPDAHLIAEEQLEVGIYTDAIHWALNRYLYQKVYGLPLESSTMQDFFDTHLHSTVGAFYEIDSRLNALYLSNPEDVAALDAGLDSLSAGLNALAALDAQLLDASESSWPALLAARNSQLAAASAWSDNTRALYALIAEQRAQLAGPLKTQNSGINVSSVYEQNEKEVNAILLGYLEGEGAPLATEEWQVLQSIAEQCPLSGGDAVFRARAFLAAEYKAASWQGSETACGVEERPQSPKVKRNVAVGARIRLFPNPAKQHTAIQWDMPLLKQGTIELYDAFGRKQLAVPLETGAQDYNLRLGYLPGGLYFLRVQIDGREENFKLIINP
ncbi:MAG: right-handed parallel beta-helix repeat-containing protein [Lewinellaceae bacterium]|nr:right-handed parallel beta-helix repeat-containing protein [Phaeodactylibacter sp.]MCB9041301.1 right-handed parallel beta-helix repeat-containing protein [Lewinellaceae bacterium]